MAYREVTMIEVKEVLRLWLGGAPKLRIARTLGVDRKTIQRYTEIAAEQGLSPGQEADAVTDERLEAILVTIKTGTGRPRGESWQKCFEQRAFIEERLKGAKLTKVRKLLLRKGIDIPYATLHRFAATGAGLMPSRKYGEQRVEEVCGARRGPCRWPAESAPRLRGSPGPVRTPGRWR